MMKLLTHTNTDSLQACRSKSNRKLNMKYTFYAKNFQFVMKHKPWLRHQQSYLFTYQRYSGIQQVHLQHKIFSSPLDGAKSSLFYCQYSTSALPLCHSYMYYIFISQERQYLKGQADQFRSRSTVYLLLCLRWLHEDQKPCCDVAFGEAF